MHEIYRYLFDFIRKLAKTEVENLGNRQKTEVESPTHFAAEILCFWAYFSKLKIQIKNP